MVLLNENLSKEVPVTLRSVGLKLMAPTASAVGLCPVALMRPRTQLSTAVPPKQGLLVSSLHLCHPSRWSSTQAHRNLCSTISAEALSRNQ
jgi:hypothetical protein